MNDTGIADISALHAILRLKAGLSPLQRLDDLTVDLDRHRAFLEGFLGSSNKAMAAVVGSYGAGKTHFLQLAKQEALKNGFAVATLTQETGLGSLSFPHRHMQIILNSLVAPASTGPVLEYVASSIEREPRQFFEQAAQATGGRHDSGNIVADMIGLTRYGSDADRMNRVLEYLSGASLSGRSGSSNSRLTAYRLLEFWIDYLVNVLDCRGLVLLIDEMEGLFSGALYWSIRSRRTAYRTLAYYASLGKRLRMLAAFTPDGWSSLQDDVHTNAGYLTIQSATVPGEDVPKLLRDLRSIKPHELSVFSEANFQRLLAGLKKLHAEARGYDVRINGELVSMPHSGLTPRIFSRSVVSALEARWFHEIVSMRQSAATADAIVCPDVNAYAARFD